MVGPPWQRLELGQCKLSLALEDSGLDRHSGHGKTGNRWQSTMPRNRTTSNNKSVHILQTRSTEISVTRSASTRKESSLDSRHLTKQPTSRASGRSSRADVEILPRKRKLTSWLKYESTRARMKLACKRPKFVDLYVLPFANSRLINFGGNFRHCPPNASIGKWI